VQAMSSNYGIHSMISQQTQFPYASQGHNFYQNPVQQYDFSWQPGSSQTLGPSFPVHNTQPKILFLATLHLPDFSRLLRNPICHDPHLPAMLTKFPSDIPTFEGKPGKDPGEHMINFHLWCSSNSLRDDSVQLHLFQHTLIEGATKWYIELDHSRYSYFSDLAMVFLKHFQVPLRYDDDTELLANFENIKADHISDHIRD